MRVIVVNKQRVSDRHRYVHPGLQLGMDRVLALRTQVDDRGRSGSRGVKRLVMIIPGDDDQGTRADAIEPQSAICIRQIVGITDMNHIAAGSAQYFRRAGYSRPVNTHLIRAGAST
jgi:hypothetical protein